MSFYREKARLVLYAALFAVLAFSNVWAQEAAATVAVKAVKAVELSCDRGDQLYSVGDQAQVTIRVVAEDDQPLEAGSVTVQFTNGGRDLLRSETFDLAAANPITVETTLDFPGYLLIKAAATSNTPDAKPVTALLGLGFDPEKIEPGLPKPDDFDTFWAEGKAQVRALALDLVQERMDSLCSDRHEVFSVSFATVNDRRVYGFLSLPVGDGPFPALVSVPGAGPGVGPNTAMADAGFAMLDMNVFPYPVPLDGQVRQKAYDDYNAQRDNRYCLWDAADRDLYFFRPVYLGIDRAIDWFAAQPFVDSERIGCFGSSQGGASALILTGMNRHIKAAVSAVPALCDHAGLLKGRSPGWPQLVDAYNGDEAVLQASRYLDAVNFARAIDVPIRVTVGFIDQTCPPSSVWSAFNVIESSDKRMILEQKLGHANGKGYQDALEWLKATVRRE